MHIIEPILYTLLISVYAVTIIVIILLLMLENRNPLKATSWIILLLLLPGLGVIFYIFFGQNFRKEKIIARKGLKNHELLVQMAHSQNHTIAEDGFLDTSIKNPQNLKLIRLLLQNSSAIITMGNKVEILNNGQVTFDTIIAALEKATKFIHMEYYIFANDKIGNRILDVLKRKAAEGVEVRLIVDDVGSWELKNSFFRDLESHNIQIKSFLQVRFPQFTSKVNYRNHRKIVVVDGKIGFLGGINVADRYIEGSKSFGIWRDMHISIQGDAVNALQSVFLIDWFFVSQEDIAEESYFPPKQPEGNKLVQIVHSGPDSDWPAIMMGLYQMIASAKKYVYLTTPYFMPSDGVLLALKAAAMGGVDVRILLPKKSDAYFTMLCSRSYIKEMLEADVKIFFYTKGFIHSKTLVVDDESCTIGTANMDFRSFEQNFEVNAFILNEETAQEVKGHFMDDLASSYQINLKTWKKRSVWQKTKESFARLFSPLL